MLDTLFFDFIEVARKLQPKVVIAENVKGLLQGLLLLHTSEGDVVFDAYAGSFSTAIACHNEKRKFIGCEILEKYFEPAMKRLRGAVAQKSLF